MVLVGVDASRAVIPQRTGTEVYSLHLIRSLLALDTEHRFRLYFNTAPPAGLLPEGLRCEHRVMPFPRLWTHARLSWEMAIRPPDLLLIPSHVLPLIHPRQSVVTVHDLGYHYYPHAHTRRQRWYLEWSTRYHAHAAARIVADSRATKEDLIRIYDAEPSHISVAYLGVDPTLRPVREPLAIARVGHSYGIRGPYVLYVGTLQPRKNLVRLIEAFARVKDGGSGHRDLQLVLAGKQGWLYDEIRRRGEDLGVGRDVLCPGFVAEADLAALYSGALLFVMPSLYEGFCMPVLEAMACGTPVMCSNTSSLPEVVGPAALTFDPRSVDAMAERMALALTDAALREQLVAKGFERCAQFTWEACARQVLAVLEQFGEGKHAEPPVSGHP
jgi:glycosyltransferase involved in cell wall biosynthesis